MRKIAFLIAWLAIAFAIVWATPSRTTFAVGSPWLSKVAIAAADAALPNAEGTQELPAEELLAESGAPGDAAHEGEVDPTVELDHPRPTLPNIGRRLAERTVSPHRDVLIAPGHSVPLTPPPDRA